MKTLIAASIALILSQTAAANTLQNGLIAHYEFEGNAKDSSLSGNDGIERNGVKYKEGVFGSAAEFNGVSSYIEVPHNDNQNLKTMTFSAWVYDYEYAPYNSSAILTKGTYTVNANINPDQKRQYGFISFYEGKPIFNFAIYMAGTGKWEQLHSIEKPLLKRFTHITVTYDGTQQKMYINGKLHQSKNTTLIPFIPKKPDPIVIGAGFISEIHLSSPHAKIGEGANGQKIIGMKNGLIDDIRLYNRALTACEVKKLYDPVSYPDNRFNDKICENQPPIAEFNVTRLNPNLRKLQLDASASQDKDGTLVKYEWLILPDGLTVTGKKPTITLPEGGVYEIVLTVTDNKGAKSSKRLSYTLDDSDCQGRVKYEVSQQTLQAPYVQVLDKDNQVIWIGEALFKQLPNSETLFNLAYIKDLNPPPSSTDKVCPATYQLNTKVMKLPFIDVYQTGFANMTYSGVLKDLDKKDGVDLFVLQNLIRKQ